MSIISPKDCLFCKNNGKITGSGYPVKKLISHVNDNHNEDENKVILDSHIIPSGLAILNLKKEKQLYKGGSSVKAPHLTKVLPDDMLYGFYSNMNLKHKDDFESNFKTNNVKTRKMSKIKKNRTRKYNKKS